MLRCDSPQHPYYCSIDLHTRKIFCGDVDRAGQIREHYNLLKYGVSGASCLRRGAGRVEIDVTLDVRHWRP